MEPTSPATEHLDVLIIGAGISGIGAAYYLQRDHPRRTYAILEARGSTGGTWDLFRYPGIRSDSDVSTFGYEFKPWDGDAIIASGESILAYVRETAAENGIDPKIRLQHRVLSADWSSAQSRWVVTAVRGESNEPVTITCTWLFCGSGYYRYDRGYTPQFAGRERFQGRVVHPQHWPADLDHAGKRVIVIGSGATAVTLVPALATSAAHVTMVQRTPSYMLSLPTSDPTATWLRKYLGKGRVYALMRRKNVAVQRAFFKFCQRFPGAARSLLRRLLVNQLPKDYAIDEHFNPPYAPWDQRLCMVAGGDLFEALRGDRAAIVTDTIETFTEHGLRLGSGRELPADIIVTATGLELLVFGGMEVRVDGVPVQLSEKVAYKGTMLDGVPNFVFSIGYTNASWTLKVGLVCEHFCRLLSHMDARGYVVCRPERNDPAGPTRPLLDLQAGYVRRAIHRLPRQGAAPPWVAPMDYVFDTELFATVADEHLRFESGAWL